MDTNMNGSVPPEQPGEEIPLLTLSPAIDRSQRAKAMSQLSLQSEGSYARDTTDADNEDKPKDKKGELVDNLHAAALSGDEAEVQSILHKGPDLRQLDKSGRTPLHNAILGRHVRIMELLLESGADPSILDECHDAPLHTAIKTGDENLVRVFLQRTRIPPDNRGHSSRTALHIAADMNKVAICELLMEHGASPECRDDQNMTPLTCSVEKGAKDAAEFFFKYAIEKQTDMKNILYGVDDEGSTLLHLAVDSGNPLMVELCLDYEAVIRQPKESDRSTAFHLSCAQGELEIVQLFATRDPTICRITLIDSEGLTPLHRAAMNNHSAIVQYLLEQGASVDPRDKHCRTPLFLAAGVGATETVQLLIESGADVTIKDVDLRSSVRVAVGHTATMDALLQKPEAWPLIVDKDITGFAPVHYAAKHGHLQNILLFMEKNKAARSVTSDALDTALHGAARYGWLEIVEVLLQGSNIRSINLKNNQGKTALHFACAEGHDRVVEFLLKLGATVERDHNDRTALHIAAMRGSRRCVQCILQYQPESINLYDKNQNTALHLAAIHDQPEVVSCLLSYPEEKILMNNKNHNVLDAAMKAEMKNVALAIAGHDRWREVLTSCAPGHIAQMQTFVIKMPDVAVRFMDQCITKKGNPNGEDYKITYDLGFIQGEQKPGQDPLIVLKTMLERRRLTCLTHPLCFILMNTKWQTFGWKYLALNLILYLLFMCPLTALAVYSRANEKRLCHINETLTRKEYIDFDVPCVLTSDLVVKCLQYGLMVITVFHMIKELLQLRKQRLKYLFSLSNYCEWICYACAGYYIFPPCDCKLGLRQEVGAIALFIGWMNLILYLRRLSSYGQYIIMLTTMFVTLFKVLLLFFLFVMAFSSTFYLLMDEETEPYGTFPYSVMTIFVMTLGELNYHDTFMPWDKLEYATMTNILFLLFVLGMPIILMNMLVGLAVGDIDKIQVNALMDRYVMQVELVLDMEETIPSWIAKRAQVNTHVEYPNTRASKIYEQVLGFSRPEAEDEEDESPPGLPPAFYPLMERIEEQDNKINGIYEILKEQTELLKSINSREKPAEDEPREGKGIKDMLPFRF